jgi:hypothetical protein
MATLGHKPATIHKQNGDGDGHARPRVVSSHKHRGDYCPRIIEWPCSATKKTAPPKILKGDGDGHARPHTVSYGPGRLSRTPRATWVCERGACRGSDTTLATEPDANRSGPRSPRSPAHVVAHSAEPPPRWKARPCDGCRACSATARELPDQTRRRSTWITQRVG